MRPTPTRSRAGPPGAGVLAGYQDAAARLGYPLTDADVAAIPALRRVFRVNMVMAELWNGARTGTFDVPMIERQLNLGDAAE